MEKDIDFISEFFFFTGILLCLGIVLLFIFLLYQRKFKFSKQLKDLHEEHQKNLLTAQLEMQEQTFQYIAQEIHDHIGQRLTLAKLYLNSRKEDNRIREDELVDHSAELIGSAIDDLKYLSRSLTSDLIKDNGLTGALQLEAERLNKLSGLHIQVSVEGNSRFLEAEKELIIFRMIQEALQNILKHAKASEVFIALRFREEQLLVTVIDNGVGIRAPSTVHQKGGSGIRNMEQRALLLKGSCAVLPNPNGGTQVELLIPY
jgi:two-component system, NarL family, sensor kinase